MFRNKEMTMCSWLCVCWPPYQKEDASGDGDDEFYAQELEGMTVVEQVQWWCTDQVFLHWATPFISVILQATGLIVGSVIDIYRGAGQHDLLKVLLEQDFISAYADRKKNDNNINNETWNSKGDDDNDADEKPQGDKSVESFVFVRKALTSWWMSVFNVSEVTRNSLKSMHWILQVPFAKEIVPVVDTHRGVIEITPPVRLSIECVMWCV